MVYRELRKFGLTVGGVFLVLAMYFGRLGNSWYVDALVVGGVLAGLGLVYPRSLAPMKKYWMLGAEKIGWVMTRVILSTVYYLIMTPIGLAARMFGKNFIDLDAQKSTDSYWRVREKDLFKKEWHERQF